MAFASLDSWGFNAPGPIYTLNQKTQIPGLQALHGHSHSHPWWWNLKGAEPTAQAGKPQEDTVRIYHANKTDPHRLALSGRLADVCAELDRLLEAAEICDIKV